MNVTEQLNLVDAVLANVLQAFDEWRAKLPTDRGFNHSEGMAFEKRIAEIGRIERLPLAAFTPAEPPQQECLARDADGYQCSLVRHDGNDHETHGRQWSVAPAEPQTPEPEKLVAICRTCKKRYASHNGVERWTFCQTCTRLTRLEWKRVEPAAPVSSSARPHTCHGNEWMPPGPCLACVEEQADARPARTLIPDLPGLETLLKFWENQTFGDKGLRLKAEQTAATLRSLLASHASTEAENQPLPPCINGECLYSCADDVCKKADEKGVPWPPEDAVSAVREIATRYWPIQTAQWFLDALNEAFKAGGSIPCPHQLIEVDPDEKHPFDNGSGMTEVMTVAEMIAEIQRLGLLCVSYYAKQQELEAHLLTTEADAFKAEVVEAEKDQFFRAGMGARASAPFAPRTWTFTDVPRYANEALAAYRSSQAGSGNK